MFIGQFADTSESNPSIFTGDIISSRPTLTMNPYADTTSPLGGAYFGAVGGRVYSDPDSRWESSLKGSIIALYVDDSNNVGILKGSLTTGSAYPQINAWEAEGTWKPVQMESGTGIATIDPVMFHDGSGGTILTAEWQRSYDDQQMPYSTTSGGGLIKLGVMETREARIADPDLYHAPDATPWGIIQMIQGGSYDTFSSTKTPLGNFEMSYEGPGVQVGGDLYLSMNSYLSYTQENGAFSPEKGGTFDGTAVGAEIVPENGATRIVSLDVHGTFDPVATSTWQAIAAGSWIETGIFVDMAATTDGRAVLDKLNIPCISVGKVDLSGAGNNLTVQMNDVNFYARSTGGTPQLWATKNVTGTYTAAPTLNTSIPLGSASGGSVTAAFTPVRWDNGKWGAAVSGSGSLSGGYTGNVQFRGGAAGSYNSGSFSGTGAGTARKP